jgi:pantoate kinase
MIAQITQSFPSRIPQNLDDIMSLSREFAEKSGLISREIRTVLTACDKENLPASMTMLGCGVFALGKRAETVLKKFGEIFKLTISPGGPAILFGERSS